MLSAVLLPRKELHTEGVQHNVRRFCGFCGLAAERWQEKPDEVGGEIKRLTYLRDDVLRTKPSELRQKLEFSFLKEAHLIFTTLSTADSVSWSHPLLVLTAFCGSVSVDNRRCYAMLHSPQTKVRTS